MSMNHKDIATVDSCVILAGVATMVGVVINKACKHSYLRPRNFITWFSSPLLLPSPKNTVVTTSLLLC